MANPHVHACESKTLKLSFDLQHQSWRPIFMHTKFVARMPAGVTMTRPSQSVRGVLLCLGLLHVLKENVCYCVGSAPSSA